MAAIVIQHADKAVAAKFMTTLKFTVHYKDLATVCRNFSTILGTLPQSAATSQIMTALINIPDSNLAYIEIMVALIRVIVTTPIVRQQPIALINYAMERLKLFIAHNIITPQNNLPARAIPIEVKLVHSMLGTYILHAMDIYTSFTASPTVTAVTESIVTDLLTRVCALSALITPGAINIPINALDGKPTTEPNHVSAFGITTSTSILTSSASAFPERMLATLNEQRVIIDKSALRSTSLHTAHHVQCTCREKLTIPQLPADACSIATLQQTQIYYWALLTKLTSGNFNTFNHEIATFIIDELAMLRSEYNRLWRSTERSDQLKLERRVVDMSYKTEQQLQTWLDLNAGLLILRKKMNIVQISKSKSLPNVSSNFRMKCERCVERLGTCSLKLE